MTGGCVQYPSGCKMLHMATTRPTEVTIIGLDGEPPVPTWGETFRILRARRWPAAVQAIRELQDFGIQATGSDFSRIEQSDRPPSTEKLHTVATVCMLLMGRDPRMLDLDPNRLRADLLAAVLERVGAPDPDGTRAPGGTPPGTRTQNLRIKSPLLCR